MTSLRKNRLLQDIVGQDVPPKVIEELLGWKHDV